MRTTFGVLWLWCIFGLLGFSSPLRAQAVKEWSYLFFIAGDEADIDPYSRIPIRKLEQLGSDESRWMVVHADLHFEAGKRGGEAAVRYVVEKHPGEFDPAIPESLNPQSPVVWESEGETNSADPRELVDFLKWARKNYPAKNYALFLLSHSWGWRGISQDYNPGFAIPQSPWAGQPDSLMTSMAELRTAIEKGMGGKKLELVVFDACNDGTMEVMHSVRGLAKYAIASPTEMPFMSFDYVKSLMRNPVSGDRLVKSLVEDALASLAIGGHQPALEHEHPALTLVGVDLQKLEWLHGHIRDLVPWLPESNFSQLFFGEENTYWRDEAMNFDLETMFAHLMPHSNHSQVRVMATQALHALGTTPKAGFPELEGIPLVWKAGSQISLVIDADPLGAPEATMVLKQKLFDDLNARFVTAPQEWQVTEENGERRFLVDIFLAEAGSARLYPLLSGSRWAKVTLFEDEKVVEEKKLVMGRPFHYRGEFPARSPYVAVGMTSGSPKNLGLSVHFDPLVSVEIPENLHWDGKRWIGGKRYYQSLTFSQFTGWGRFLFGGGTAR